MKKRALALLLMLVIIWSPASAFAEQATPGKVILDTDMFWDFYVDILTRK